MIWLLNHDTGESEKMSLLDFIAKFNNGEIPDELYTISLIDIPLRNFLHKYEEKESVKEEDEYSSDEAEIAALLEIEKIVTHLKNTGALTEH